jgi:hypothetical protein
VIAAVSVAVAITYDDPFVGFNPQGLVIVVALPILAWVLLAPTSGLALWGGLLFLPGVARWAVLLTEPSIDARDDTAVIRAYPLVASVAVAIALTAAYAYRWIRRRRLPPAAGGRPAWAVVRVLVGVAALLTGVAIALTFPEAQNADAVGIFPRP